jgi:hypothetical protein
MQQIIFFEKNKIDLSNVNVSLTVTDSVATSTGQSFINFIRNRNNRSAWLTTGSSDAGTTTIEGNLSDVWLLSELLLIGHNFKSFTFKYYDSGWQDFSPAINETSNTDLTTHFNFTPVSFSRFQLIINGTQTANVDKILRQMILTTKIGSGQFEGWPIMKRPQISTNKKKTLMLSGKVNVVEGVESFSVNITTKNWSSENDLDIIEDVYTRRQGVLVWPCGGDETQFRSIRKGYTKEDIFLMRPTNEYQPEWASGFYKSGMKINMKLAESID